MAGSSVSAADAMPAILSFNLLEALH